MMDGDFYKLSYYLEYGYAMSGVAGAAYAGGMSVWQFTRGRWALLSSNCQPGYETGPPPREKGGYEGECKRTPCRRKGGGA